MSEVKITATESGPYKVEGPVTLLDDDGDEYEVRRGKASWLCRCGRSGNKPFCDGTHNRVDFVAEERATDG